MFAEQLTTTIIDQIDSLPALPKCVPISIYESQHDYELLRPEDQPARVDDHTALMHIVAENLRTEYNHKINIVLVPLNAAAYLRYLHATCQKNTAASRAAFIATAHISHS